MWTPTKQPRCGLADKRAEMWAIEVVNVASEEDGGDIKFRKEKSRGAGV